LSERSHRKIAHEDAYEKLYSAIITGAFEPGKALTLRGVAEQLNCSPTPVREAVRRLVALGALEMRSTRRIAVAPMTQARFEEIWTARTLLEPEIAARAASQADAALIKRLTKIDSELNRAIDQGDPHNYSRKNWEFHFTLYRASQAPIMLRLVESLWLQFGPFMRLVSARLGTSITVDHHLAALNGLSANDPDSVREAIRLDINDGMERIQIDFQE